MARIEYSDPAKADDRTREILGKNRNANIFRMMAHSPSYFEQYCRLGGAIRHKGELDPVVRELAITRTGILCEAPYEIVAHKRIGKNVGVTDEQNAALENWQSATCFNEVQRAALAFADEIVKLHKPTDATFNAIASKLTPAALVELQLSVGFYIMTSKFLETFAIDMQPVTEGRSASSVSPLPTAPNVSPSTMRADGTALVIALRTWASCTEPPVRNTASMSSADSCAWVRQFLMRAAMRSANCLVWLTRSGRLMAALRPGATHSSGISGRALVRQRDLGVLDLHRQRMAALFLDHAHQPVEQFRLAGLLPDLADIGEHARLVHPVDARPGGEVVEIARGHIEPGALHRRCRSRTAASRRRD